MIYRIPAIDQLAVKFCDDSVYCETLDSLHNCIKNMLEEGYRLLDTTTNQSYEAFESYMMDLTYDIVFFKITQLLLDQDKLLAKALESMEYLDYSQIGLPPSIHDARKRVYAAIAVFEKIGSFRTPAEKLDCLLTTLSELAKDATEIHDEKTAWLDSDSLIPLILMTLVKSKVPHLTANLVYMKDYTFERNIVTGKYAYALSTFEGVLEYIMNAWSDLSALASQNLEFFSSIQHGQLSNTTVDARYTRDPDGNTALMIACKYGHTRLVSELLLDDDEDSRNDLGWTPLMIAIQHSTKSLDTIRVLLDNPNVQRTIHATDRSGDTALLHACRTNDVTILQTLLLLQSHGEIVHARNTVTRESALHLAARHAGSAKCVQVLLAHHVDPRLVNYRGETMYHVCESVEVVQTTRMMQQKVGFCRDHEGNTPAMTWARKGRLDLVELVTDSCQTSSVVDAHGRTLLHLIAMARHWTLGKVSVDTIVQRLARYVHVREWVFGNTPLHCAVSSSQNKTNTTALVKALIKYGAVMETCNFKDEYPIHVCRLPELVACLEDVGFAGLWTVTRAQIEQSTIYYIVKSGLVGKPESMQVVRRTLDEFILLRNELLRETPELFLPTFKDILFPESIELSPWTLVNSTLTKLQSFMDYLQHHPMLRTHPLVVSFVCPHWQQQQQQHAAAVVQRKLQLEKMSLSTSINEEEYFLGYIEDTMKPLKACFEEIILAGRKVMHSGSEMEGAMMIVAQALKEAPSDNMFLLNSLAIKSIEVSANITFGKSFVSPWSPFSKVILHTNSVIDGILLSLQRPYSLLRERKLLKTKMEDQKEILRKTNVWQNIFLPKEKKKQIEENHKTKVVETMNELNHIDSQINQSHKTISDELAYFQTNHPKQITKAIRHFVKLSLKSERYKLDILHQTLNQWEKPLPTLPP